MRSAKRYTRHLQKNKDKRQRGYIPAEVCNDSSTYDVQMCIYSCQTRENEYTNLSAIDQYVFECFDVSRASRAGNSSNYTVAYVFRTIETAMFCGAQIRCVYIYIHIYICITCIYICIYLP